MSAATHYCDDGAEQNPGAVRVQVQRTGVRGVCKCVYVCVLSMVCIIWHTAQHFILEELNVSQIDHPKDPKDPEQLPTIIYYQV